MRWLPQEKLHLTLVFLGSTAASRANSIAAAVDAVAKGHGPFEVATGDAGGRVGGRRGGVAWLRLASGAHEVAQLALDIDDALGSATFDDHTTPRPHLTLARGATEAAISDLRAIADRMQLTWTVDRIVLFRSHTHASGSRYEPLAEATLARPVSARMTALG